MSDLLSRIEKLSPAQRKLLELRKAEKLKGSPITRASREGRMPLSSAQQRLWFVDQLMPGNAAYNIPIALRVEGELDREIFRRAVNEIMRRHEILRTSYQMVDGEVWQEAGHADDLVIDEEDLRQLADGERDQETERLVREEAGRPFDLAHGPLVRVKLLQLKECEHVVLLVMHHIVSDGWSGGIFVREFSALYEAFRAGKASPLPEMPLQYGDYAVWQRRWLQGEVLEQQLDYWRRQLAQLSPLDLPTDFPRPAALSPRGATESFVIPKELNNKLLESTRGKNATLFMGLLTAFQVLLNRYTGQQDIAVGTDIANRNRVETESLIGFFVNQLVLRMDLGGNSTFTEILKRAKKVTLDAYQHQDVPFEKLVEELAPERELNRSPLFQVKLVLQNMQLSELHLAGLRLTPFPIEANLAKFDFQLTLSEGPEGLTGVVNYARDLYEPETVERLMRHFELVLEHMVRDPEQKTADVALFTQRERTQVLDEWNRTETAYPNRLVHELFEQQAARTPEHVAVEFEGQQLNYAELNFQATQLANYLRGLGVGPEVRVAICVERGIGMLVGLLGILKAGGAYVPLDFSYPAERLSYMLEDAQVPVLVTQASMRDHLPTGWMQVVSIDEDWPQITREPGLNLSSDATEENIAYVIYTSGSTGQPKGVAVTHRGLANYLKWAIGAYQSDQGSGSVVHSSLSFDLTVTSIYPALLTGRTVKMLPQSAGVEELAECLECNDYSLLKLTPSHLQVLGQLLEKRGNGWQGARALVIGGEALRYSDLEPWRSRAKEVRLINEYGPTETVVGCVIYEAAGESSASEVPIGKPIANTTVYVADENLHPVPVGVAGELYLGGAGLARGYLNRPDLTAEKFVPNPFNESAGTRLYRTGDRVKWQANGQLVFLGRLDHQVKLRGYRIELGEIEAALLANPVVEQAAVTLRSYGTEQQLVGYIVARGQETHARDQLREYLGGRLPEYMVPAAIVVLAQFPLTPNGKLDHKALPEPDFKGGAETEQSRPRTAEEEILCGIFAEVLKQPRIGVTQNFFEAGGHSLLATQVVSRVWHAFAVELPLRALFESPTVEGLAEKIKQARASGEIAPPLTPRVRGGDLPLSFAQQRLWFLHQLEPESLAYNLLLGIRLSGALNREALEWSLNKIVERHEVLRTTFAVRDGSPVQIIHPKAGLKLEFSDLRHVDAAGRDIEVEWLAGEESRKPFDLARGPLVRARLLQLDEQEYALLVVMHHVVSDGWSLSIMIREFAVSYAACLKGEASPLPELAIQYADFAVWQREWLQGEVLERELAYWREQLAEVQALELPTDYPRPPVISHSGARVRFEFGKDLTASLKQLGQREDATVFMVLLAGFQLLLSRYSGQRNIAVGTPIANRTRVETERLIGFFVNTLVLRTDLNGQLAFRQLLARVRKVALEAYTHQDVPFEKLVEELDPDRDLSRPSLFQTMLVLQNLPEAEFELSGLKLAPLAVEAEMSKFDLTVTMVEHGHMLKGACTYRTDLFDHATIERLARHWEILMASAAADTEQSINDLPLLSASERRQLIEEWNHTSAAYPAECMHEWIEQQARQNPNAVAVECQGERLSYADLNCRANQLAHYLRKLGVSPESRVGLHMERSLAMVMGVLGIAKAGGAYVPLDAEFPPERLAVMIEDADAVAILSQQKLLSRLAGCNVQIICPDEEWSIIASESEDNPASNVHPENLVYVLYTSGSTGKPKGVCVEHRQLVNYVRAFLDRVGPAISSFAMVQPLAVDSSVTALFGSLAAGKCVYVIPREQALDGAYMAKLFSEYDADALKIAPSHLAALQAAAPGEVMPRRLLVIGGEASRWKWARSLQEQLPECAVFNHYGPTETTVGVTTYRLGEVETNTGAVNTPLGKPLANTQLYILDEQMEPVPIGVAGELYVGGENVTRGYLNRPDLTAERFVPDPFEQPSLGKRLYKTGDRARYLASGDVEFLGRFDDQVKLRGYRIELGEIEAVLAAHAEISQVVVVMRGKESSTQQLVAYVVPKTTTELDVKELRSFVQKRIPEYMVPAAFVLMQELPRSAHGKLDRKRLPEPEYTVNEEHVLPRTPEEKILGGIFAQVLKQDQVSVTRNFFEAGGHSLLAIQVLTRVRSAFGLDLPLRAVFEAPTVAGLAERLVQLRAQGSTTEKPSLTRISREGELELSYAQQRLWFLMQVMPGNTSYHIPIGLRLRGELKVEAVQRGIREIVKRHEVLRTRFESVNGKPQQVIEPEVELDLAVVDISSWAEAERETELRRLAGDEAGRPFDLQRGPLVRARLVRLGEQDHGLLITMHHIVSDAVSTAVAVREMTALYQAYSRGEESPLKELPVQYADYVAWQRSWLKGEVLEKQVEYWKKELEGVQPLQMPVDRPVGPQTTARGAYVFFALSKEVSSSLKQLSRKEDITVFMTLMAAFHVLLYRYTGQLDFAVGTPIAGRTAMETEDLIGFFVNTLVLPAQVGGSPSFREALRRVKEKTVGAYAHQDVPFERLVDSLQIERNVNRSPLFQAMFGFQNAGLTENLELGDGVRLESLNSGTELAAKFELLLAIKDAEEQFGGSMQYFADLWEEATMEAMMRRLERLLAAVAENPEQSIDGIALLSEEEREQIESQWRRTEEAVAERGIETLEEWVRQHAQEEPARAAVVSAEGEELSYAELEQMSGRVALRLRSRGVGAGAVVGISVEGMREWLVVTLGVLKTGAAFVGVDVVEGQGRSRKMLEDAGVEWLVVEGGGGSREFGEAMQQELGVKLLEVEELSVELGEGEELSELTYSFDGGESEESGGRLACVLYRSGESGKPEGIWINHRTLCGAGAVSIESGERVALRLGMEEESGSLEMFRVLASGGCVVEVRRRPAMAPRKLAELLSEQKSGVMWSKAVELERLAREFPEALEGVRVMVCAEGWMGQRWVAEALPEGVVERVYGAYGMAEVGGVGVLYRLQELRSEGEQWKRMRLNTEGEGRGGRQKRIYVLDSGMRAVPEGVVGEIYVGGGGEQALRHGGAIEETAQRWVPDPWSGEPAGGRLYRTGDYGRRRRKESNGEEYVEYVGRRDRRAVVGGMRVHEEEIEAVLRGREGVQEAAVVIISLGTGSNPNNKDGSSNKDGVKRGGIQQERITAWVVRNEEGKKRNGRFVEELLGALKQELPEVMIPQQVLELEELPKRVDGEVNRGALLRMLERAAGVKEYVAASTVEEEKLVEVWEQTLEKKPIGVHDNFFSIGGDSLLATQLVARMSAALEVEVPLRRVFELPTIAQLAPVAKELKQVGGWRKPALKRVGREGVLELSYAQQRLWFLMQVMPGNTSYHIPIGLRLRGELKVEAVQRGIREIVKRHEVLRTRFESVNGKPRQVIEPEINLDLNIIDLSSVAEAERGNALTKLGIEEAKKPFDLQRGPLVRALLARLGEQDHGLLITMHHIVSDAVSTAVAVREMTALYQAYSRGEESPLKELPVQYADYAAWQRNWLKGEVLEKQLEYWKKELEGVRPLQMPVDRPLGPQTTARSKFASFLLSPEVSARLRQVSQAEEATIFAALMAGFQILLYRYSGQQDFAVGSPVAGRTTVELEDLIGFFVNTLVLSAQVGGSPSFREVLRRMKEKTIGAYAHQDVPFERLVDSLQIERNVNRSPLFQAMFAFQNATLGTSLDLGGGVHLESVSVNSGLAAKFELLLAIADVNGQFGGSMQYYADLWDEATMETMMRRLERLLAAVAENPEQSIDGIALLSEEEREQIESQWRRAEAAVAERRIETLEELVRQHAQEQPERVAVVSAEGEELSYGELEQQSGRVALRLRSRGVGAGAVVGVSAEGMREWLVASLGVLKTGATFVGVDAVEGQGRSRMMLEDAGVEWLVVEEGGRSREFGEAMEEELGVKPLQVEELSAELGEGEKLSELTYSLDGGGSEERGERLACVLYRSGESGKPEGIWINQRTLCGAGVVGIESGERVALRLGMEEEAGSLEMFRVLAAGGCVVEVRRRPAMAPRKLAELLSEQKSGVMWGKAVELERLAREFPEALEGVRVMVCAEGWMGQRWVAEALPEGVVERVYGAYGMAEVGGAGVLYGLQELRSEGEQWKRMRLNVEGEEGGGRQKRIYVLDSGMRAVPEGVVGEIYVGGGGEQALRHGEATEKTAPRWVPDPWSGEAAGGWLYRTGDYGRRRKEGSGEEYVEFVGRRDRRMVVGGMRVHEEEIETVLRKREGVQEAAVVISSRDKDGSNNKDGARQAWIQQERITAWVVRNEEGKKRNGRFVEELLGGLKQELPEVMVPQQVLELEELPKRVDGGVNRGALLRMLERAAGVKEYVAASTVEEEKLVEVWEQTLEKKPIGVHDNFFSIGGDSLLATQLVARMSAALEVEVPLRRVFELPTIAQLAPVAKELKQLGGWRKPALKRVGREGVLELSYAQQRLWFLMQVMPGNTSYHIPIGLRLRGELKVEAVQRGIREIVKRHEVLRTRFESVNGKPQQVIEPEVELDLAVVDISSWAEAERETELKRLAGDEAGRPFDLQRGPLVRARLVRLGEQDHGLLITMHHIVSDAVSTAVAVREMTALYQAYSQGEESPLKELPVQYADYAAWQRSWLKGEVLEKQVEYWKKELEGVRPLQMPVDHPLGPQTTARSGFAHFLLNKEVSGKLKELSRTDGATIFATLMAAVQVLLYRYSGQQDFAIGSPIAGRNEVGTEDLIGFFVNTLVLPAQVSGSPSFREVLRRMKEKTVGAYAHQDVPFERLVDSLQIERNVNRSPLFQVMFAFQNATLGASLDLGGGVSLESLNMGSGLAAKFELLLAIRDAGEQFGGSMQYYADLWDEATMESMMRRLERLLAAVAENPEQSIEGIALLSEEEREQIESQWRRTEAAVAERGIETLEEWVRQHAQEQPERAAVVSAEGEELSYGELEQQSGRVAVRLRSRGVGAGAVVGVSMEGMREWLVASLGVLKTGATFVGVDAVEGQGRSRMMLEDAGVEWLVVEEGGRSREFGEAMQQELGVKLLEVEDLSAELGEGEKLSELTYSLDGGESEERGGRLACVLYRSGESGKPEGIWINQRTLCGAGAVSIGAEERVALRLGMEEEAGSLEMFRVLASGGCVVEVRRRPAMAPRKLAELLSEQKSGVVWGKAVELERLAREFPEALEGVRVMVCAEGWMGQRWVAEALPEGVVERVYGAYGMAEVGGAGVLYRLQELRSEGEQWKRMRLNAEGEGGGRQSRIYVLDSGMRAVPEGVVGEIYVGGREQALGHGEAIEETAQRWVPDPWSGEAAGGWLYRTGDYGRRRKEGNGKEYVEYVGRRDRRMVVGGMRVHEEEIETVLRKREGVQEAAVVISSRDKDGSNNKDGARQAWIQQERITAWVVRNEEGKKRNGRFVEELLGALKQELPEVMIPQQVLELEELPKRVDGEVNRGVLLRMLERAAGVKEYVAASTVEEEKLVEVWEQTLEKKPIGVHDNFFSIGGDSLLATQLVARMSAALEVEVPLRRVFELPTIAQLAPVVKELKQLGGWRKPALKRVGREGVLELSYAQQRLWFLMQVMPGNTSYHIPIGLRLRGELKVEAVQRGIREIVKRHEVLRTRFESVNGKPQQVIEPEVELDLAVVDISSWAEAERETELKRLAGDEAGRPFDLQRGPLVRARLVRLGEQDHGLLITMHHIVSDAVSTAVAVREMTALYQAYSQGEESPLKELPVQYADYAAWQRSWLKGEVLEKQVEYWKKELEGVRPLQMPVDYPLGPQTTARSGFAHFLLNKEVSGKLKELSRTEGATIFATLMAAVQVLLYRYSGQQDFAIGSPIAGRNEVGTEDLIGFFVNTLVLPAQVSGSPSFREVLRRMKEKTVGAYAHQDVPFERLVDSLQIERNVNRSPLFQVMFAFQNATLGASLDLGGGVSLESLNMGSGLAAKFELLLAIRDAEEQFGGSMQYYADLWDEATMESMMRRLERLLAAVAENPEQSIEGIALLSEEEREQIESQWRRAERAAVARRGEERGIETLEEWVRQHAQEQPERAAVVSAEGEELSYGELEQQSGRVALRLRSRGVGAGAVVGVSVEGMREWLVASLGVLKTGAAFVGVDAVEAHGRSRVMLEDAGVEWLVVEEGRRSREFGEAMQQELGVKLLEVEELSAEPGEGEKLSELTYSLDGGESEERGGRLACVLYRSGESGKPEGIWINQRTLCGAGAVSIGADERVALRLGMEEEAGSLEMFRVLASGGCVVEMRRRPAMAPRKLAELLSEQKSGVMWGKAVELERLAREFPEALEGVRVMVCAEGWMGQRWVAEALPEGVVERVYGAYGMAEVGGAGVLYRLQELKTEGEQWRRMRLNVEGEEGGGRQKRIYVLDSGMRAVPEGVVGEIYIDGGEPTEGENEGYVAAPWSGEGGGWLYRTGDYGRRRRKEGSGEEYVEFVGRRDRRTVVGGMRVHEEEIETMLRKREGVQEAAVVISSRDKDGSNNKDGARQAWIQQERITAWVVRNEEGKKRNGRFVEELLGGLKQALPEVMVPQQVLELEELPKRVDGGVNRGALLRMLEQAAGVKDYVAASTVEEEKLVEVWEQTLEKKPIGVHDNFFSSGGNSLLAAQLIARISATFSINLPVRRLFEAPTISQLAPIIVKLREKPEEQESKLPSSLVPLRVVEGGRTLFCFHPMGGGVSQFRTLINLLPDVSIYGLQAEGFDLSESIRHTTLEGIAGYYVELIRSVQKSGPYWLIGHSSGGVLAFEAARILSSLGEEVAPVMLLDTSAPGLRPWNATNAELIRGMADGTLDDDAELEKLQGDDQLRYAIGLLNQRGILPANYTLEMGRRRLEVIRNNMTATNNYLPEAYAGQVLLFAASSSSANNIEEWKKFVSGSLDVRHVAGRHSQLLVDPFVDEVAAHMRESMESRQKEVGAGAIA